MMMGMMMMMMMAMTKKGRLRRFSGRLRSKGVTYIDLRVVIAASHHHPHLLYVV